MKLNELDAFLKERLAIDDFPFDVSLNGVQVACSDKEIRKIGFAVDASLATIKAAAEQECDMLFVHHGLFWGKPLAVSGPHYERIRTLIGSDTALYACHLPLDAHPVYGNNAQMAMALGIREYDMFGMYHGSMIGVKGNLPFEMSLEEVCGLLGFSENTGLRTLPFGKEKVKSVGIISGGGGDDVWQAVNDGLDLYITGEISHQNFHEALEDHISVIAGGHYQSETYGVKAVLRMLMGELGIEGVFLPWPTAL